MKIIKNNFFEIGHKITLYTFLMVFFKLSYSKVFTYMTIIIHFVYIAPLRHVALGNVPTCALPIERLT